MIRKVTDLRRKQDGFTLVELLVVVAIVVALATVSVVSVTQFAGKGDEGALAAEMENVQSAMDTMMADVAITAVTANDAGAIGTASADFSAVPVEGPVSTYMRDNPTAYFYCWDATGKVTEQFTSATLCTL